MKKETGIRIALGFPLGLAINFLITIIISLVIGDGNYHGTLPALTTALGGELKAVIVQALATMFYGAVWGGAATIFEREDWSLLRQTLTHFAIGSLATLPIAYFLRWMQHSLLGFVKYFGFFILVYGIIWLLIYAITKRNIDQINAKVKQNK